MPKPKKIPRGAMAPNIPAEVARLYARASAAGVSMLHVCRVARVHHSVVNRWRLAQASPTLRLLHKLDQALTTIEREERAAA